MSLKPWMQPEQIELENIFTSFGDKKKVIITGCPRSGTGYAAKFFTANGIVTGHECFGDNGISSWCLATANNDKYYGPSWEETKRQLMPCPVFHQVRNPVEVIASLLRIQTSTFAFLEKYVDCSNAKTKLEKCMKIWLDWNIMCERIATHRYQVEKINDFFQGWKEWPDKKYNTRSKKKYIEKQLHNVNSDLWDQVVRKAIEYGYSEFENQKNNYEFETMDAARTD